MADTQQSIEDKLASHFDPYSGEQAQPEPEQQAPDVEETEPVEASTDGDESQDVEQESAEADETESDEEGTQSSPYVEVVVNGKTYEVPEELKESLIHGEDYTRKTQDLARQAEAADMRAESLKQQQENLQFENSLSEDKQLISLIDAQIKQYKELDWSELSVEQSLQHKMALDNLKEQKSEVQSSIESRRTEWGQQQEKVLEQHRERSSDWLRKAIPGWNQDLANAVAQDAIKSGYTEQEVNSINDPRAVKTLFESMEYRKLKANTANAKAKASTAPPVIKPGSVKKMPPQVRDKLNYKKQMARLKKGKASEAETAETIRKRLEQTIGNL